MTGLTEQLKDKAHQEGFADVRICRPGDIPQASGRLNDFVSAGFHGQMKWMAERMIWRGDPQALWPEARSVIMLAENYGPMHDPRDAIPQPNQGIISVYAQNQDYHDIVKKRLKRVGRWLIEQEPDAQIKVFVDTAPVMEKPLAQAAGLGWQGKHTNLVSRKLGSWFFLGSIFSTLELESDAPEPDHCGTCSSCIDSCPTDAFLGPHKLDARRCISYLTIEHSGPVDAELRPLLGNRIYACDDCLAVCPWNKYAKKAQELRYHSREELEAPDLAKLVMLDDAGFRQLFRKSPVKRIGRNRFVRNVLYAIGNSGLRANAKLAKQLHHDSDAIVKDAALWAFYRLMK